LFWAVSLLTKDLSTYSLTVFYLL